MKLYKINKKNLTFKRLNMKNMSKTEMLMILGFYYFGKEKKEDVTIVKENFTEKKENNIISGQI